MKINKLSKLLKLEKEEFFTIDDIGNERVNSGILILNSGYFNIFLLTLDKSIDDRARALDIEEYLEGYLDDYSHFSYIEKEMTLYKDENIERVLVILLKRDIVEEIIENCMLEKIKISGIYPIFFIEFFNKTGKKKEYLEIDDENFYIFSFCNDKIVDFKKIDFMKEELLINFDYLKDFLDLDSEVITYSCDEIYSMMEFLIFKDFKKYHLKYRKDFDFLPFEYREEIEVKKVTKILSVLFLMIIFIFLILSLLLNIYINKSEKDIELEQFKIDKLQENINKKKKKIIDSQMEIEEIEKNNNQRENKKISSWLESILMREKNIDIKSIEYMNKKIYILGSVKNRDEFYKFQQELLESGSFKELNHDFFKWVNNKYEFKIEAIL